MLWIWLLIEAAVGDPDGVELIRSACRGATAEAAAIGAGLAENMLARGAGRLLAKARES